MTSRRISSLLVGLLIVLLGLAWLASNLDLLTVSIGTIFGTYWPLFFVALGIGELFGKGIAKLGGFLLIVLGGLFLGNNLQWFLLDLAQLWQYLWPLLLIILGWLVLSQGQTETRWAIMSGIERKKPGWQLQSGGYFALLGGVELDLSTANIPDGETILNLTAILGGIEIKVPAEIQLSCEGSAVLGGLEFFKDASGGLISSNQVEQAGSEGTQKKVKITCFTFLGGVEIQRV